MKTIKIFLASSEELRVERLEMTDLVCLLNQLFKGRDLEIELKKWEHLDSAMSPNGGKVGRKKGSIKTDEQKREEYKEVIQLLKKGYSVRNVAKISNRGIRTIQRIKTDICL